MMAWRVHEYGPPDVMRFEEIPRPDPGPGWRQCEAQIEQGYLPSTPSAVLDPQLNRARTSKTAAYSAGWLKLGGQTAAHAVTSSPD
jgi:hypothetical protein